MYHGKEAVPHLPIPSQCTTVLLKLYNACPSHPSTMGRKGQSANSSCLGSVNCTITPSPISHRRVNPYHACPMYMGRKGNIPNCTTCIPLPSHPIPLFIPSQCTMGRKGQSGNIPNCTTPMPNVPWNKLYHPSCLYHRKEGMCTTSVHPIPMCHGTEWEHVPPPCLSIPSQCTMGRKGQSGNIPNCTTPHAIPMYHGPPVLHLYYGK